MSKPYCLCSKQDDSQCVPIAYVTEIEKHFNIVWSEEYENDPSLSEKIKVVLSVHCAPKVSKDMLERLSSLKIVASVGAGYNHLDVQMIRSHGVKVSNTPGVLNETVADLTMALILAAGRNIVQNVKLAVSPDTTQFHRNDLSHDVWGATLGIVGMGGIGYKVAERAKGFKMKILYNNRKRRSVSEEEQVGATYYSKLDEMLPLCDYVVVLVPASKETTRFFGAKQFKLMKPSAIFVNVSRGIVVDQEALVTALTDGQIHSAALDVTDPEPLPRDHPLLKLNNVIITPHCASATVRTRLAMVRLGLENAVAALEGKPLPSEVFH